ncbi:MAG: GNAT family N-acetyltransferase [Ginsengibacter sp.]
MITIKPAKLRDIPVINQLAYRIWPATYKNVLSTDQMEYMLSLIYGTSSLRKQIKELNHKFIVIYKNKIPLGFASYSLRANSKNIYKLHKIYILKTEQGKGIGNFVLNKITDEIKLTGAKYLELNVNRSNKAVDFYKKNGFKIIGEEDIDIDNGYFMNDYVMRKII